MNGNVRDVVSYRLGRARETLVEAQSMLEADHWNACVNRLYYACFYAVSGLLLQHGLSSSRHTGIRSLFSRNFGRTGRVPKELVAFYNELFERRQQGDYEDFYRADPQEVHGWLPQAERLIQEIEALVEAQWSEEP